MSIARYLDRTARLHPNKVAIVQGGRNLTYAEVRRRVGALARNLSAELAPGDRVGLIQRNGVELLESLLACFQAGLCVVPLNARLLPQEAADVGADAGLRALVHGDDFRDHNEAVHNVCPGVRGIVVGEGGTGVDSYADIVSGPQWEGPPKPCSLDDTAWLFYTSGTTGRMKGAMLTHRNLMTMVAAYLSDIRVGTPESLVLHAAPLTHGSGLYALAALACGATQVMTTSRSYDPAEINVTGVRLGVTDIAFLAPTMVNDLVAASNGSPQIPTLEQIVYGGAPMYGDDLHAALSTLGPVLCQIYGQAEAPVTISRLTRGDHQRAFRDEPDLLQSAGTAYSLIEMGVDTGDVSGVAPIGHGEVCARGDVVMSGYWSNPDASAEVLRAGWLHTGDVGRIDDRGYLFLLDRNKDVIISGGSNIYPREIEEILLQHPLVRAVAVVGAPDPRWGERVVAVVALHDGSSGSDSLQADLDAMSRNRLAGYKVPRQYDWVPELPTNSYGKILKREVRDRFWTGQERRI